MNHPHPPVPDPASPKTDLLLPSEESAEAVPSHPTFAAAMPSPDAQSVPPQILSSPARSSLPILVIPFSQVSLQLLELAPASAALAVGSSPMKYSRDQSEA
jgi:hypothetical protein